MRSSFRVSVKAVIFNYDRSKVLTIFMEDLCRYGLPGGHMDEGESIEDALARELFEECGIRDIDLKRGDFFMHPDGKIVLAHVGQADREIEVGSQQGGIEGVPTWLDRQTFQMVTIDPGYRRFILENW